MTTNISLEFSNAIINGKLIEEVLVELSDVDVDVENGLSLGYGEIDGIYSYDSHEYIGRTATEEAIKNANFMARVERELDKHNEEYFAHGGQFQDDCERELDYVAP